MATRLSKASYDWALRHLLLEGDTDLLPPLPEIEAIKFSWREVGPILQVLDLENYQWGGERRFVVPKESLAFRSATQLDPLDSLVLAAVIKKFGDLIEGIRIPVEDRTVFSHRFSPTSDGRFFGETSGWHEFWKRSIDVASQAGVQSVVSADITDCYNQIYHHVLENQLKEAGLPNGIWSAIKRLISHLTQTVTRGVPVGPHAMHLLAEAALNPIDRSMLAHGLCFCRYVDDFHIFCASDQAAVIAVHDLVAILDDQQRLALHKQKTRVWSAAEFIAHAESMLSDRPLDDVESDIVKVIKMYGGDNPYFPIDIDDISPADLDAVRAEKLEPLLADYLAAENIEYGHVRWLLRRLAQMGAPGAIDFVLGHLDALAPALGDVARYVMRASPNYEGNWPQAGDLIVTALKHPFVQHSEYLRLVLLHLFAKVPELNHMSTLTSGYATATGPVRREIVFAARAAGDGAWLRERKAEFEAADPWLRRAIVASSSAWPGDERDHWVKTSKTKLTFMEKVMARWALNNRKLNVGPLSLT